ncbi:MAG: RHS repeat-associated core domain-containing protein, partial [Candidatus Dormibacteria bacterium]
AYDAGGRVQTQTDPSGLRLTSNYSADGSVGSETYGSTGTVTGGWCYGYNAAFQITAMTFGTGSTPCSSSNTTYSYGYDNAGRLSSFTPGSGAAAIGIAHDPTGNRLSYTDPASGSASVYCYRADDSIAQQLPGAGSNCTSPPTGTSTYSYTSGFDQLSSVATSSSTVASYCYDVFGRMSAALQSAAVNCASPSGATSLYAYDGLNRQISHRDPNASGATGLHYDGLSKTGVLEDMTGQSEVAYALTPSGTHAGLMSAGTGSSTQYLVPDGSGNVSAVFGSATSPACAQLYDPFGTQESAPGVAACTQTTATNSSGNTPDSFWYRGGRRDPGTGTYQLGSRTYDPAKGSFLSPDEYSAAPSSANARLTMDPLTLARYNYVNGDPVNLSDPSGHDPCGDCNGQVCQPGDECGGGGGSCADLCTNSGTEAPPPPAATPGGGPVDSGCHSDSCMETRDQIAQMQGLIAQLNLYFACDSGRRSACHALNEVSDNYEQYLSDLGSRFNAEMRAVAEKNAAAATEKAKEARKCDGFFCGVTQAAWGAFMGLGSLVTPASAHIVNDWVKPQDNPWLAGSCEGLCWGGQITTIAATSLLGGAGVAGKAGEGAAGLETLLEGATDATAGVASEARGGVYALRDVEGSVVRTGRTNDLARRQAEHALDPTTRDLELDPLYRTDSYAEQRGLEQVAYDAYQGAPLNRIRPISLRNPNLDTYMQAAQDFLAASP